MNKKNNLKTGIVLTILFLAIGFAAVTTTLMITGKATIGTGNDNFQENILFATAQLSHGGTNVTGATITKTVSTADTISFEIPNIMTDIGDEYILTYTVRNNSQYNAKLGRLECTMTSSNSKFNPSDYLSVVATNKNAGKILARNATSSEDTIVVKLKKSYTGEINGEELGPITVTITGNIIAEPDTFEQESYNNSVSASQSASMSEFQRPTDDAVPANP